MRQRPWRRRLFICDLHKRAVRKSISEGISLNRLVRRALEKEVGLN